MGQGHAFGLESLIGSFPLARGVISPTPFLTVAGTSVTTRWLIGLGPSYLLFHMTELDHALGSALLHKKDTNVSHRATASSNSPGEVTDL